MSGLDNAFPQLADCYPWDVPELLSAAIVRKISVLGDGYVVKDSIAVHRSATVEKGAILKGPLIIGPQCFVAAHAYLRNGVYLSEACSIGPGVEIKASFIGAHSRIAHFNYIGNSLIGKDVNMEAGAVIANHFNEKADDRLSCIWSEQKHQTHVTHFGALVGDYCCIGANAVLSPGTILAAGSVVPRLGLIDQSQD